MGEKYTPKNPNMTRFEGHPAEDVCLKVLYGVTVITQRCGKCGALKAEGVPGQTIGAS